MAGLFFGKQIGVFGAIWLADRHWGSAAPRFARWAELYGASLLCGVGFTMSLFIGALAFPTSPETVEAAKIGTLAGSLLAAICGWAVLRFTKPIVFSDEDAQEAREIFGDDQYEAERARRERSRRKKRAANRPERT